MFGSLLKSISAAKWALLILPAILPSVINTIHKLISLRKQLVLNHHFWVGGYSCIRFKSDSILMRQKTAYRVTNVFSFSWCKTADSLCVLLCVISGGTEGDAHYRRPHCPCPEHHRAHSLLLRQSGCHTNLQTALWICECDHQVSPHCEFKFPLLSLPHKQQKRYHNNKE